MRAALRPAPPPASQARPASSSARPLTTQLAGTPAGHSLTHARRSAQRVEAAQGSWGRSERSALRGVCAGSAHGWCAVTSRELGSAWARARCPWQSLPVEVSRLSSWQVCEGREHLRAHGCVCVSASGRMSEHVPCETREPCPHQPPGLTQRTAPRSCLSFLKMQRKGEEAEGESQTTCVWVCSRAVPLRLFLTKLGWGCGIRVLSFP